MYYYIQDNEENILLFDPSNKERLHNTIVNFMPQYKEYEIKETETKIVSFDNKNYFVNDEEYIEKSSIERKNNFLKDFFKVGSYGYYRKQPKGYQSATESLNTAFNNFTVMQKMGIEEFPADVFIFYEEPDFTDPEQCTEEWLVAHQTKNKAMTAQEFGTFYTQFTQAWNAQEHN